jgi:hypothetical protein
MKRQMYLWQENPVEENGSICVRATIETPEQSRKLLWYRLPIEYKDAISSSCDPFLIAIVFMAMRKDSDLVVRGEVSPSLLKNLEEFQAIWSSWRQDRYKIIRIDAEIEREQSMISGVDRAISTFSGGVDSCFTAFRHRMRDCGRQQSNLQAGLMVHGFDIPLEDSAFDRAVEKSRIMLTSIGMEMIPIATNFRKVIKGDWEDIFGTGIASCLHLLQKGYNKGLIASSHAYRTLNLVYGSNPLTDPLLSSQSFEITHDSAFFTRLEKIQKISQWSEALENLRVCWQGEHKDRNCGRCEKCVRNILNFRILGHNLPSCFEQDVTDRQISRLRVKGTSLKIWETLLENAKDARISDSWVATLEKSIERNRFISLLENRLPPTWQKKLRQLYISLSAKF